MDNIQSKYFNFNDNYRNLKTKVELFHYSGWNSLFIIKIHLKKNEIVDFNLIDKNFTKIKDKQKIFVLIDGECNFKIKDNNHTLNSFDAVDLVSGNEKYEIKALQNTMIFMVSASNLIKQEGDIKIFNFKRDVKSKNLWGGQIISRPYESKGLTFVLFDLKKGFKFEDKGHANEQITWLISGEMDFYTNNIRKKLDNSNGVDIGPNHLHGGVSGGAVGFDVFFPKRQEIKYKN